MRFASIPTILATCVLLFPTSCSPAPSSSSSSNPSERPGTADIRLTSDSQSNNTISIPLFIALEELSRIVDISYCVGTSGISHPFECASRCDEFPGFELVTEFNTGPLMSDSCGYVVLDHGKSAVGETQGTQSSHKQVVNNEKNDETKTDNEGKVGRIIVAFRGTYSIANTIVDLSTVPQEYVPYPGSPANDTGKSQAASESRRGHGILSWLPGFEPHSKQETPKQKKGKKEIKCNNCTVHSGFWQSWQNTRSAILPHLEAARALYPEYNVHLVGHSLGGAVAALAGLELDAMGWEPIVTTFGEPKVGNTGLRCFIDDKFSLPHGNSSRDVEQDKLAGRYRRVTHIDDPVPLLPLVEWGYRPHAGEVYISKSALQPGLGDLQLCAGDEDEECSFGAEAPESWLNSAIASIIPSDAFLPLTSFSPEQQALEETDPGADTSLTEEAKQELRKRWGIPIPSRYKIWQLLFAHRDYFWRLGLCVRGGDPSDWGREKYRFPGHDDNVGPQ